MSRRSARRVRRTHHAGRLSRVPAEGEKVSVELRFEKSGPITAEIPVEATNHAPRHHH